MENIETVSLEQVIAFPYIYSFLSHDDFQIPPITFDHFQSAMQAVGASVSAKDIEMCKHFHDQFGYNK